MPNTITESLKSQIHFSQGSINNTTPVSILPSTNTALKQSLQAKYPSAVISSYLEIRLLDLSVKIDSITEYELPESVIEGVVSPVGQNRDLVRSLWDNPRKQLNVYHKFGIGVNRLRGSISLLNKGSVNSYYLENLMGILTTEASYPVSANEDILIGLADAGYGLLLAADEILFTGVFTHYLTVTNDSFLNVNGQVIELATFDQLQSVITNTNNTATAISTNASNIALNTTAINNLGAKITSLENIINSLISASNGSTPIGFTKNYNSANPSDDLINLLGTNNGTVAYVNPHPSKITNSASSVEVGNVSFFTDRINNDFYTANTTNSWVMVDFGSARTVRLNGLGWKSRSAFNGNHPANLIIEGSNNNSSFELIANWQNIGFTNVTQDRYTAFAISPAYRYIRVRQSGLNSSSSNFLSTGEIYFYGTISAL